MEKQHKPKMKISGRILIFKEGKDPEHDMPDEVINLRDQILNMEDKENAEQG